jgi:DNA-binding MarR family transcriptional regulator
VRLSTVQLERQRLAEQRRPQSSESSGLMEIDDMRATLNRMLELAVLVNDDMSRDLARRGLTSSRAHLLWELRDGNPRTQQTLATALGVTPRTVTGLVDGLVAGGFVTREPHPNDRRATLVTFTAKGQRAARALEFDHITLAHALFDDMPETTLRGLTRGLDAVLERFRTIAEQNTRRRVGAKAHDHRAGSGSIR